MRRAIGGCRADRTACPCIGLSSKTSELLSARDQTGHRSVEMVRRYIRAGSLFQENAAGYVGL